MVSRLPLWFRFLFAFIVSAALFVALVLFVSTNNTADSTPAKLIPGKDTAQLNQLTATLIGQEEAPQTARLPAGAGSPAHALSNIVARAVIKLEATGEAQGPIDSSSCLPRSTGVTRVVYRCTVEAANVRYPYAAVLVPGAPKVTYCRIDPSLVAGHTIPLSPRCS